MCNGTIPPFPSELRDAVAEVVRSTEPFLDDLVKRSVEEPEGRVILALCKVKRTHGRARREALRELDRVVTDLFPPVEGAPLPSEELNGKPDVLGGTLLVGASAPYYCGPVEPTPFGGYLRVNPNYSIFAK